MLSCTTVPLPGRCAGPSSMQQRPARQAVGAPADVGQRVVADHRPVVAAEHDRVGIAAGIEDVVLDALVVAAVGRHDRARDVAEVVAADDGVARPVELQRVDVPAPLPWMPTKVLSRIRTPLALTWMPSELPPGPRTLLAITTPDGLAGVAQDVDAALVAVGARVDAGQPVAAQDDAGVAHAVGVDDDLLRERARAIVTSWVDPPMSAPSIVSPSKRTLAAAGSASAMRADAPGSGRMVTTEGLTPAGERAVVARRQQDRLAAGGLREHVPEVAGMACSAGLAAPGRRPLVAGAARTTPARRRPRGHGDDEPPEAGASARPLGNGVATGPPLRRFPAQRRLVQAAGGGRSAGPRAARRHGRARGPGARRRRRRGSGRSRPGRRAGARPTPSPSAGAHTACGCGRGPRRGWPAAPSARPRGEPRRPARSGSRGPRPAGAHTGPCPRSRGRSPRRSRRSARARRGVRACRRPRATRGARRRRRPPGRGRSRWPTRRAAARRCRKSACAQVEPVRWKRRMLGTSRSPSSSSRGPTMATSGSASRTAARRSRPSASIRASGLRKSTSGALPAAIPRLQPNAKPPLRPESMACTGRSATTSSERSGEALSTTVTPTPGSPTSGSTQSRSVSRLL